MEEYEYIAAVNNTLTRHVWHGNNGPLLQLLYIQRELQLATQHLIYRIPTWIFKTEKTSLCDIRKADTMQGALGICLLIVCCSYFCTASSPSLTVQTTYGKVGRKIASIKINLLL